MREQDPSTPSHQPDQPEQAIVEQIPHSGIHHDERPIEEFDNTSLRDAVEQRLVSQLPDTPQQLLPEEKPDKKRRNILVWTSVGAAAVVVAVGGFVGVNLAKGANNGNSAPEKDPKGTSQTPDAKPSPTATYEAAPSAEQLAQYNIPADATSEQMALIYTQMQSEIRGGILKPSTRHEWAVLTGDQGMTSQAAAEKIAAKWVKPFFDAQYQVNYMTVTSLLDQYNLTVKRVAIDIKNYTGAGSVQESYTLDSVAALSSSAQERQLQITQTEHYSDQQDPSDPNIAEGDGYQGAQTVTFELSSDGTRWVVSDWQ